MPLKLKPTVLDRLKELEGDAKARRISEALPILASGITPMEPCIHITETSTPDPDEPSSHTAWLDKTMDQIAYAIEHGIATITFCYSPNSFMIKRYEKVGKYNPITHVLMGYVFRLYVDNLESLDAGKIDVEYTAPIAMADKPSLYRFVHFV